MTRSKFDFTSAADEGRFFRLEDETDGWWDYTLGDRGATNAKRGDYPKGARLQLLKWVHKRLDYQLDGKLVDYEVVLVLFDDDRRKLDAGAMPGKVNIDDNFLERLGYLFAAGAQPRELPADLRDRLSTLKGNYNSLNDFAFAYRVVGGDDLHENYDKVITATQAVFLWSIYPRSMPDGMFSFKYLSPEMPDLHLENDPAKTGVDERVYVATLQTWLNLARSKDPPLSISGTLDDNTRAVLREYQTAWGLHDDSEGSAAPGSVLATRATWAKLDEELRIQLPPGRGPIQQAVTAGETATTAELLRARGLLDAQGSAADEAEALKRFKAMTHGLDRVDFGPSGRPRPAFPHIVDSSDSSYWRRRLKTSREGWGIFYGAPWLGIMIQPKPDEQRHVWATATVIDALGAWGHRYLATATNADLRLRLENPITVLRLASPSDDGDVHSLQGRDVMIAWSPTIDGRLCVSDREQQTAVQTAWLMALFDIVPTAKVFAPSSIAKQITPPATASVSVQWTLNEGELRVTIPTTFEQVRRVFEYMRTTIARIPSAVEVKLQETAAGATTIMAAAVNLVVGKPGAVLADVQRVADEEVARSRRDLDDALGKVSAAKDFTSTMEAAMEAVAAGVGVAAKEALSAMMATSGAIPNELNSLAQTAAMNAATSAEQTERESTDPGLLADVRRALVRAFLGEHYTPTADTDLRRDLPTASFVQIVPGAILADSFRALIISVGAGQVEAQLEIAGEPPAAVKCTPLTSAAGGDLAGAVQTTPLASEIVKYLEELDGSARPSPPPVFPLIRLHGVKCPLTAQGKLARLIVNLVDDHQTVLLSRDHVFTTLSPQSPVKPLSIVVASCYYDYFGTGRNYGRVLEWLERASPAHDWPFDRAAFKLLIGDNLYLDVAPDISDRSPVLEDLAALAVTWNTIKSKLAAIKIVSNALPLNVLTFLGFVPQAALRIFKQVLSLTPYIGKQTEGDSPEVQLKRLDEILKTFSFERIERLAWSETLGRYLRYFLTGGHARALRTLPTFVTWDDHEHWNDYPWKQIHMSREDSWLGFDSVVDHYKAAAQACLEAFQLPLNPPSWPGSYSYCFQGPTLDGGAWPQASFCVIDDHTRRTEDRMTFISTDGKDSDMGKLRDWATSLPGPGVLVLGQPLIIKATTIRIDLLIKEFIADHNPPFYEEEYRNIWEALQSARWDVLVIAGDVHHSRLIQVKTGTILDSSIPEGAVWEYVTSPACHVPTQPFFAMEKHEQDRDRFETIDWDWLPPVTSSDPAARGAREQLHDELKAAGAAASAALKRWADLDADAREKAIEAAEAKRWRDKVKAEYMAAPTPLGEDAVARAIVAADKADEEAKAAAAKALEADEDAQAKRAMLRRASGFELAMWSNAQNTIGVVGIRPVTSAVVRVDLAFADLEAPRELVKKSTAAVVADPDEPLFEDWPVKPRTSGQSSDGLPRDWIRGSQDWSGRRFSVVKVWSGSPWRLCRNYDPPDSASKQTFPGAKPDPDPQAKPNEHFVRDLVEGEAFTVMGVLEKKDKQDKSDQAPLGPYQILEVRMDVGAAPEGEQQFIWGTYAGVTCYRRIDPLLGEAEDWLGRWFKVTSAQDGLPGAVLRGYDPGAIKNGDSSPPEKYPGALYPFGVRQGPELPPLTEQQFVRALQVGERFTVRRILYEDPFAGPELPELNGRRLAYQCLEVMMADGATIDGESTFIWGTWGGVKCYEPWDACIHSVYLRRRFSTPSQGDRYRVTAPGLALREQSEDRTSRVLRRDEIATFKLTEAIREVQPGETFEVIDVQLQAEQTIVKTGTGQEAKTRIEGQYQCLHVRMDRDDQEGLFLAMRDNVVNVESLPRLATFGDWNTPRIVGQWRSTYLGQDRVLDWVSRVGSSQYRIWIHLRDAPQGAPAFTLVVKQRTWSTIDTGHELIWLDRSSLADPDDKDLVLDWVPATGDYRLYKLDLLAGTKSDGTPDILPEPPVAKGNWATIRASKKLIYLGGDRVLDWEASTGNFRIWTLDRDTADPNHDPLPNLEVRGTWATVVGHRIINLGGDRVLTWLPATGAYRVWRYDRSVKGQGDPLVSPPLEGTLQEINEDHELTWLGDDQVLDWQPGAGAYRIRTFDRTAVSGNPLT